MNFINTTKLFADFTMGTDKTGREWLVVVAKATYALPARPNEEPKMLDEQLPLVATDAFTGEPGFSAPLYEIEYAPRKPRCDVLLNGSAHSPGGRPVERVTVKLRVGNWSKSFDVVGKRTWRGGMMGLSASPAEPFAVQPISYNVAFGGTDKTNPDVAKQRTYLLNHVGIGYHDNSNVQSIVGQPLPLTEEVGKPINNPKGNYKPMAFGPLGRAWQPRIKFAGTYDQNWLDRVCPFLPEDFKEEYFQAAPDDQQIDFPKGGEEVELINLTPTGRTMFRLPTVSVPVEFFCRGGERSDAIGVLDTIVLEPDLKRFHLCWRCSKPIRRNIREYLAVVVGDAPWNIYREHGLVAPSRKQRFDSLSDLPKRSPQQAGV